MMGASTPRRIGVQARELSSDDIETAEESGQSAKKPATHMPHDIRRQTGDFTVYKYFFGHVGRTFTIGFFIVEIIWAFLSTFPTVWLNWWAQSNAAEPNERIGYFLGGYAVLQVVAVLSFGVMVWFGLVIVAARSGAPAPSSPGHRHTGAAVPCSLALTLVPSSTGFLKILAYLTGAYPWRSLSE